MSIYQRLGNDWPFIIKICTYSHNTSIENAAFGSSMSGIKLVVLELHLLLSCILHFRFIHF